MSLHDSVLADELSVPDVNRKIATVGGFSKSGSERSE